MITCFARTFSVLHRALNTSYTADLKVLKDLYFGLATTRVTLIFRLFRIASPYGSVLLLTYREIQFFVPLCSQCDVWETLHSVWSHPLFGLLIERWCLKNACSLFSFSFYWPCFHKQRHSMCIVLFLLYRIMTFLSPGQKQESQLCCLLCHCCLLISRWWTSAQVMNRCYICFCVSNRLFSPSVICWV